jgi:hypothetical protein
MEVLDLIGGAEKVVLLARADGTPASDEEDGDVFDYDDDSDDDGLGGLAIPVSRRRAAKEVDTVKAEHLPVSRRAAAKEAAGGGREAIGAAPGLPPSTLPVGDFPRKRGRPFATAASAAAAAAAAAAAGGGGCGGGGDRLSAHLEFPPSDDKVSTVLAIMKANDAARMLSEMTEEQEPSGEVFRLGYKMGAQRAIACCAAIIAAAAARRQTVGPPSTRNSPSEP